MDLAETAFETTAAIAHCHDVSALAQLFADRLKPLGLSISTCGMVTGPKAIGGNPFHFVNWPAELLALYLERGYVRKDPLARWALVSGAPMSWTAVKRKLPRNDPAQEVYRVTAEWGLTEGLAVPVRSASGDLGLVTCGGKRGPFDAREELFIQTISTAIFHRAVSLETAPTDTPSIAMFSRREREILNLLHHGFKDREIAQALEISIETVRSHLENARLKVGARSRTELVSRTSGSVAGDVG